MDRERFDALTRLFAAKRSRRAAVTALLSAVLLGQDPDGSADARRQRKSKGRRRRDARGPSPQAAPAVDDSAQEDAAPEAVSDEPSGDIVARAQGEAGRRRRRGKRDGKRQGKRRKQPSRVQAEAARCCSSAACTPGPGKNLGKCCYEGRDLSGANFRGANLGSASFARATLASANFSSANLDKTCFVDADLTGAKLAGANTGTAVFCRTTMPNGSTNDSGCDRGSRCCPACDADHPCGEDEVCCAGRCRSGDCCSAADCPEPNRPLCLRNTCSPCTADNQCGPQEVCCEGSCVAGICCTAADCGRASNACEDYDCRCGERPPCAGETPYCCGEGDAATCRECCGNTNCPPNRPVCLAEGVCGCTAAGDCPQPAADAVCKTRACIAGECTIVDSSDGETGTNCPEPNQCLNGGCVRCIDADDCPPASDPCQVPICTENNTCDVENLPDFTTACPGGRCCGGACRADAECCPSTEGENCPATEPVCREFQCACESASTCPPPPNPDCQRAACANGECGVANEPPGTTCPLTGPGGVCLAGACVACLADADCGETGDDCTRYQCNTATNSCEIVDRPDFTTTCQDGAGRCCAGACQVGAECCESGNCPAAEPVCQAFACICSEATTCPAPVPDSICQVKACQNGDCAVVSGPDGEPGLNCEAPNECCDGVCCTGGQVCAANAQCECPAGTPNLCQDGVCRECCGSVQCPDAAVPICGPDGTCVPCSGSGDSQECSAAGKGNLCCTGQCQSGNCCDIAACPSGETCDAFQCACGVGQSCASGFTCCGGECVDTQIDVAHCGGCSQACDPPPCNTATCSLGQCGATPVTGGTCMLTDNPATTGVCCAGECDECCTAEQCIDPAEPFCVEGTCVECEGAAGCDNPTPICTGNTCSPCTSDPECGEGGVCCGGSCFDAQSDPAHCGGCDPCAEGQTCQQGACGAACGSDFCLAESAAPDCCDSACVNLDSDPANCGSCGSACGLGQDCDGGGCACACPDFACFVTEFGLPTDAPSGIYPVDVAISPDGGTAFVRTNNYDGRYVAVLAYDARTGALLDSWGEYGSGNGEFQNTGGIAAASDGTVYVTDTGTDRVQYFDPNGAYRGQFGGFGREPGQFNQPEGVAVVSAGNANAGHVYVADSFNGRIQYFSATGARLGGWGGDGSFDGPEDMLTPTGVAVSPDGTTVYVADSYNDPQFGNRVLIFTATGEYRGELVGEFNRPRNVAAGPDGTVYVADTSNHRVQAFTAEGQFIAAWGRQGSGAGEFNVPYGMDVAPDGTVFVADALNRRVQAFCVTVP